jgi:hypothetical protein
MNKSIVALMASLIAVSAFAQAPAAKKEEAKPAASAPAKAEVKPSKSEPAKKDAPKADAKAATPAK